MNAPELLTAFIASIPSLAEISSKVEIFSKTYEHSLSSLSTIGTWAAVIAAIWLGNRASKPRLKVYVDKIVHIPSEAQTGGTVNWNLCQDAISVTLTNKGQVRIFITYYSFYWRFPWRSFMAQQNPYYPNFRAKEITLEPGQSVAITLINDILQHKENMKKLCKLSKIPYFLRRFITLKVYASDGTIFTAKFGRSYKKEFF